MKKELEAANAMYPLPVVLVTTHDGRGNDNIMTAAWTTNVSRKNPCVAVSVGKDKLSFKNIENTGDFVINICSHNILKQVDFCGGTHGQDIDKFKQTGLTAAAAVKVGAKLISECPINLECRLRQVYAIDTGNMVIGEIVKVHVEQDILDGEGRIDYQKLDPVVYAQKTYFKLGDAVAKRGFSQEDE